MFQLFNTLIFEPIYNALVWIYTVLPWQDFGLAIIVLTILIKVAMISLSKKQIESQKRMQDIQPKIKALQEKYKDDKERQTKEMMAFYKEEKINPLAGCLPLIVQLIIFLAMYQVIILFTKDEFTVAAERLYGFVQNPEVINTLSFTVLNLAEPNGILAILAAVAMYYQSWMLIKKNTKEKEEKKTQKEDATPETPDFASIMTKQMLYVGPVITLIIGFQFAAGLTLYWLTSILFTIVQQYYVQKNISQSGK